MPVTRHTMDSLWIVTREKLASYDDMPDIAEIATDHEDAYETLIEIAELPLDDIERLALVVDRRSIRELMDILTQLTGDRFTASPYPISLRSRRAVQMVLGAMNDRIHAHP